tara:strand:+ start:1761 stop:1964 length:204 start_codon:yes stop_codon:yes gene_type:complete
MARTVKKTTKKKKDDRVAYTPLSDKEKERRMKLFIEGLKSGKIKAPLPADLGRGGRNMTIRDFGVLD